MSEILLLLPHIKELEEEEARAKVQAAKATGRKFAEAAKVVVEVMTRKKMGYVRIYYLVISWCLIVVWISAPNRIGF